MAIFDTSVPSLRSGTDKKVVPLLESRKINRNLLKLNTYLKVSCSEVEDNIQKIYQIHEVVKTEPYGDRVNWQFGKWETEYDDPKVV